MRSIALDREGVPVALEGVHGVLAVAPAVGGGIAPTGGAMSAGTKIAILAAVGGGAGVAAVVAASGGDSRSQD